MEEGAEETEQPGLCSITVRLSAYACKTGFKTLCHASFQRALRAFHKESADVSKRAVIVHYHLFKNAGSSVDKILQENFPESWAEVEGPHSAKLSPEGLLDFIRQNPTLEAVSSHTAVVSVPQTEDIDIIPIIFVRHPVDRIRSAYQFERTQDVQTPGAVQAKKGDFADYMNWRLSTPTLWQVKNFHAQRLKDFNGFTPAHNAVAVEKAAFAALEHFPMIGLVEHFEASMAVYRDIIGLNFPDFKIFKAQENRTADPQMGLDDNLSTFAEAIGQDVYDRLVELNQTDLALHARLKLRFS